MKKTHFSVVINAPKDKVYKTMLSDATYREWAGVFSEGSMFQGDWSEGSTMRFLGPDPVHPGQIGGMISKVVRNLENTFVSLENTGQVVNGVDDMSSEEVKKWQGGLENYTFNDAAAGTELLVDVDLPEPYADMMAEMWPKALAKLKEISERA